MSEHSLIIGFQDKDGRFDVFATVRSNAIGPDSRDIVLFPTRESVATRLDEMLSKGLIAEDSEGYYLTGELK